MNNPGWTEKKAGTARELVFERNQTGKGEKKGEGE